MGIDQSPEFLSDIGLQQSPAKSTMSDGNAKRDYLVFEDMYYSCINITKCRLEEGLNIKLYEMKNKNIKIIDATIMSLV